MKYRTLATICLAYGCLDQEVTRPPLGVDAAIIAAHSPLHHGVSPNLSPASTPAYAQIDGGTADGTQGSLHLSVDASGPISRFPDDYIQSVAVFGYGWVDGQTNRGIVAVIHPAIGRDSHQNPAGWHTHPVLLAAGTASSTFCLAGIGTSQGGLTIRDDVMTLNIAQREAGLAASALDVVAAFVVAGDAQCPELAPGVRLGVHVLDAQNL